MNDGGGGDERWVSGGDETLFVEGSRSQYSAPPRRRRGAGGGREELGWANRSARGGNGAAGASNEWDCLLHSGRSGGGNGRCDASRG